MLEEEPDFDCEPETRAWPIWLAFAIGIAAVSVLLFRTYTPLEIIADNATQCPARTASVTAVLIDVTDSLSGAQEERIVKEMKSLCRAVPQHGRLDLFVLDGEQKATQVFSMCSPGEGLGGCAATSNESRSRTKWEHMFFAKVEAALRTAMAARGSNRSPLIEAINDVCARSFSGGDKSSGNALIIVSDMLHNTPQLNQYRGSSAMDFGRLSTTSYYSTVKPTNIAGVRTQVFYLRRANRGHLQNTQHKEFWRDVFKECGASVDIAEI
ncbi:MAG: hypothetical protein KKF77_10000 [Proteobacteria bacterium]|nr:hypothetical protein [Pseudomonadota bacterium]